MSVSDKMVLSVIVPVYKAQNYIDDFMRTIVSQVEGVETGVVAVGSVGVESTVSAGGFAGVELIAVDDGSPDESGTILDDYAARYSFIKVIHQTNAGPAAARNAGLDAASGEWIYFADPDDKIADGAISYICGLVKEKMGTDGCGNADGSRRDDIDGNITELPDVFIFDAIERKGDIAVSWEHFTDAFTFTDRKAIGVIQRQVLYPYVGTDEAAKYEKFGVKAYDTPIAAPWDKLYRKAFLDENGLGYNESLRVLDDMFFNMEVFGFARRVEYIKHPVYEYVRNDGSITSSYVADRVERDMKVWKAIEEYIGRYSECEGVSQNDVARLIKAFCKRVVKSYAISCKLCLFNKNNHDSLGAKLKKAGMVLNEDIYRKAFLSVSPREVEWKLRPVLFFGRRKMTLPIYMLTVLEARR